MCDAASKEELAAAAREIKKQTPFVNAVIANAGVLGPTTGFPPRAADTPLEEVQKLLWSASVEESTVPFKINLLGPFLTFLAFLDLLDAGNKHSQSPGKGDHIQSQFIAIGSEAGLSRIENVGYPYDTSKAATAHLTRMLSTNFAKYGIRANMIVPGLFITELTEVSFPGK